MTQLLSSRKVSAMQMSYTPTPDGATVTPVDDYVIWLRCAELPNTYGSLANVLADSTAMTTLMSTENAVNYMLRSITNTSGKILYEVVNSETAMEALDASSVALTGAFETEEWYEAMLGSSTAVGVLDATAIKVPTMTGDSAPSGVISASSVYNSTYAAYKAVDGSDATFWQTSPNHYTDQWIRYQFTKNIRVYKVEVKGRSDFTDYNPNSFSIQGSNNGSDFTTIQSFSGSAETSLQEFIITDLHLYEYSYIRVFVSTIQSPGTNASVAFSTLQVYGKELV